MLSKVNDTLDQVDWNQMGRIGKIVGIFAAVIVAQILIKGILDTINLLPVVPGLLELLALWWWASGAGETHHQRQAQCTGVTGAVPASGIPREVLSDRSSQALQAVLALEVVTASEQVGVVQEVIQVVDLDSLLPT